MTDPRFENSRRRWTRKLAWEDEFRRVIVTEYKAGRSVRAVAEIVCRDPKLVRRILKEEGVERRPVGRPLLTGRYAKPVAIVHDRQYIAEMESALTLRPRRTR